MFNIIGDIAGQFKTLEALLEKMPNATPVSVGDMIDRGPESHKVVDFFMKEGKAVLGNHEHIMLDYINNTGIYDPDIWFINGGDKTFDSYVNAYSKGKTFDADVELLKDCIPPEHLRFLNGLPASIEATDLLITHAPVNPVLGLEKCIRNIKDPFGGNHSVIWNTGRPRAMNGVKLQVFGHNASKGVKWYDHNRAVCIDTSHAEILTGIHWPSMEIFQQEFLK